MSTTESLNSASCRAGVYSQLHQTRPRTITLQHDLTQDDYGLALCLRVILDSEAHRWVQAGHPRYTGARKGRPWVVHNRRPQTNDRQTTTFLGQTCFEANKYRQTCCQRRQVLTDTCVLTFLLNLFFFEQTNEGTYVFRNQSFFCLWGESDFFDRVDKAKYPLLHLEKTHESEHCTTCRKQRRHVYLHELDTCTPRVHKRHTRKTLSKGGAGIGNRCATDTRQTLKYSQVQQCTVVQELSATCHASHNLGSW